MYLEASDSYATVHQKDGKRLISSKHIRVFEDSLSPKKFFRVRRTLHHQGPGASERLQPWRRQYGVVEQWHAHPGEPSSPSGFSRVDQYVLMRMMRGVAYLTLLFAACGGIAQQSGFEQSTQRMAWRKARCDAWRWTATGGCGWPLLAVQVCSMELGSRTMASSKACRKHR